MCSEGGLNRRKKTPEELAAEAEEANLDDFTSKLTVQFKHDPSLSGSQSTIKILTQQWKEFVSLAVPLRIPAPISLAVWVPLIVLFPFASVPMRVCFPLSISVSLIGPLTFSIPLKVWFPLTIPVSFHCHIQRFTL